MAPLGEIAMDEVALHNKEDDLWVVIDGLVYDLTKFQKLHPGGMHALHMVAGKDATVDFFGLHKVEVLQKYKPRLVIGKVAGHHDEDVTDDHLISGRAQPIISSAPLTETIHMRDGWHSPYHNETHAEFRRAVREFVVDELLPEADQYEESGEQIPLEVYQKMGQFGLLAARIGRICMDVVADKNIALPSGLPPDKFDYFHESIAHEEVGRLLRPGYIDGLGAGFCIAVPPLIYFGKQSSIVSAHVVDCLRGDKRTALAVSEPGAGSDVAGMFTHARLSDDGKTWSVFGCKKWITGGQPADSFVTGVRTDLSKKGAAGLSQMWIPRIEGVNTRVIKTSYSSAAGTSYVTFDDVKIPNTPDYVLGKLGQGMKQIAYGFNKERLFICMQVTGQMRQVQTECWQWANQRMVFGQKLTQQPVIRFKLGRIAAIVDSVQAYVDSLTYQMQQLSFAEAQDVLGGPIALLKYYVTRQGTTISDEACQVFGGRALTPSGMGRNIARYNTSFKFASILGGSEEIMADLGVRQAMRFYPQSAKL